MNIYCAQCVYCGHDPEGLHMHLCYGERDVRIRPVPHNLFLNGKHLDDCPAMDGRATGKPVWPDVYEIGGA